MEGRPARNASSRCPSKVWTASSARCPRRSSSAATDVTGGRFTAAGAAGVSFASACSMRSTETFIRMEPNRTSTRPSGPTPVTASPCWGMSRTRTASPGETVSSQAVARSVAFLPAASISASSACRRSAAARSTVRSRSRRSRRSSSRWARATSVSPSRLALPRIASRSVSMSRCWSASCSRSSSASVAPPPPVRAPRPRRTARAGPRPAGRPARAFPGRYAPPPAPAPPRRSPAAARSRSRSTGPAARW